MIITIDGPTASGKSTASRLLADRLHIHCLSSGALYRGLAYILINIFNYSQEALYNPATNDVDMALDPRHFLYKLDGNGCGTVWFDNQNITSFLKTNEISHAASILATHQSVRDTLTTLQRLLAQQYDLVLEGRDAGSVVFPQATSKFFLTADIDTRARRWQQVQNKLGIIIDFNEARQHIQERDARDRNREIAPLIIPEDALIIDNSNLTIEKTIQIMIEYIEQTKKI
ncbi:MAG: (d)CMP kinase [Candidatus Babeliales bacterium]